MKMPPALEKIINRVEQARELDEPAAQLQGWLGTAVPSGPPRELLRGEPLGHPLHPALVLVPLGAWTSSLVADFVGEPAAARKLLATGCITAVPAAVAGGVDWLSTDGPARRVGLVHAATNSAGLVLFASSWRARRRGRRLRGMLLSLLGTGCVSAGGWLGGHLAYSQGVGVDTTGYAGRQGSTRPSVGGTSDATVDGSSVTEPAQA